MNGVNHPTPDEPMTVLCPHGHDRRVTWCVWCEDPARMTAAAPLGPTPVVMATPGGAFSGEASRPRELLGGDVAFPSSSAINRCGPGLTKRELFAAMAMQGLQSLNVPSTEIARLAVEQADLLLKELAK